MLTRHVLLASFHDHAVEQVEVAEIPQTSLHVVQELMARPFTRRLLIAGIAQRLERMGELSSQAVDEIFAGLSAGT